MKKVLIFIGGVVTGAILMIFIAFLFAGGNSGMTLFEKEGDCISKNSFKVVQVLDSGNALANEIEDDIPLGITVLFLCENGKSYYDEQIIKIPSGKCAKQVGIYKYLTKMGIEKTVPVVVIRDK